MKKHDPKPFSTWHEHRERLNHDILCNQVLNELSAARRDPTHSRLDRLRMWIGRENEYRAWLDATLNALALEQILEWPEFDKWDREMRESFGPLLHEVYLSVTHLEERIAALHLLLREATSLGRSIVQQPESVRSEAELMRLEHLLKRMSLEISSLPKEIGAR